jgi:hypothetical protein
MTSNAVTFVPSFINIYHFIIQFNLTNTLTHTSAQATCSFHKSSLLRFCYVFTKRKETKPYPGGVDDIWTGLKGLNTNSICELLQCGNNCAQSFAAATTVLISWMLSRFQ